MSTEVLGLASASLLYFLESDRPGGRSESELGSMMSPILKLPDDTMIIHITSLH